MVHVHAMQTEETDNQAYSTKEGVKCQSTVQWNAWLQANTKSF